MFMDIFIIHFRLLMRGHLFNFYIIDFLLFVIISGNEILNYFFKMIKSNLLRIYFLQTDLKIFKKEFWLKLVVSLLITVL